MNEEDVFLACRHAIATLIERGNTAVAVKQDGKWKSIELFDVYDYLRNKLNGK